MIEAVLYCDASVKAGFCGIGLCLLDLNGNLIKKQSRRLSDRGKNNTEGEAAAIIEGIKLAQKHGFSSIRIYTDSKSLVQVANRGKGGTKMTRKFVKALSTLKNLIAISIKWVKGHSGQKWNTLCDKLARNASWSITDLITIGFNRLCGNWDVPGALV